MTGEGTSAPMAAFSAYAAELLASMSGGGEILAPVVKRLCATLEEGGTCAALSEFGEASEIERRLLATPVAGGARDYRPLVVDGGMVYFQRYFAYETAFAKKLLALAATEKAAPAGADGIEKRLLSHALAIVTGGPGTGKTTLAARLISLLARDAGKPIAVALAAPTGKAAAHLAEAVATSVGGRENLILSHGTVHRLLGPIRGSASFRHGSQNPLPHSVVVLDEASMADLPLAAKLADAVDPASTRLIFIGDPGQLPSIYCGSVLRDIVEAAESRAGCPLADCHIRLTKNHRSGEQPDLAALIDAAREGRADEVVALLRRGRGLSIEDPPMPAEIAKFAGRELGPYMRAIAGAANPGAALEASRAHRLVCMLRQGPCGADAVNEAALELAGRRGERIFHGLPIIVRKNDASQNLFNGDSGVIFRAGEKLAAYFDGESGAREVPLQALPAFDPACALTVHGSQGSEYGTVALLLPPSDHPMLTRELFYTGVSRARGGVKVLATPELIRGALSRREKRASGLAKRLA